LQGLSVGSNAKVQDTNSWNDTSFWTFILKIPLSGTWVASVEQCYEGNLYIAWRKGS
jgi:hypothetical protein